MTDGPDDARAADGGTTARPAREPATLRPDTLAVRGGLNRSNFDETSEGLFLTQGYVYPRAADAEAAFAGELDRFAYSRYGNPTVGIFEEQLRLLEGAEACFATATGMSAAFTSIAALVRSGDRIVAARALFGSTTVIFEELLAKWGVRTDYVDGHVLEQWEAALATPATVVFFETPSNPMQDIVDIRAVCELAHRAGADHDPQHRSVAQPVQRVGAAQAPGGASIGYASPSQPQRYPPGTSLAGRPTGPTVRSPVQRSGRDGESAGLSPYAVHRRRRRPVSQTTPAASSGDSTMSGLSTRSPSVSIIGVGGTGSPASATTSLTTGPWSCHSWLSCPPSTVSTSAIFPTRRPVAPSRSSMVMCVSTRGQSARTRRWHCMMSAMTSSSLPSTVVCIAPSE